MNDGPELPPDDADTQSPEVQSLEERARVYDAESGVTGSFLDIDAARWDMIYGMRITRWRPPGRVSA